MFKLTERWTMDGDLVTVVVTVSGAYQTELMSVAPTGKKGTFSLIDIWRIKDGKITDIWHNAPIADSYSRSAINLFRRPSEQPA
jgi:predicted ester cyclase